MDSLIIYFSGSDVSSIAMSPVTPPTEDDEKSLRIDTGSPPTPQKIPGQRISSKDPSKDYLDVTEECQPKPQAVVPPMHSETSPVSNDDNRGLVPGCKFYGSIFCKLLWYPDINISFQ